MPPLVNYHLKIYHFTATVFLLLAGLGLLIIYLDNRPKTDYAQYEGRITSLKSTLEKVPMPEGGNTHFIALDSSPAYFEVFVATDIGFRPKLEMLDSLKTGDPITVYYLPDEGQEPYLWQGVKYIYRYGKPVYIDGYGGTIVGLFITGLTLLAILILYILKRKEIIS